MVRIIVILSALILSSCTLRNAPGPADPVKLELIGYEAARISMERGVGMF